MKIAYVKSLEERCKKVMMSQNIEKPKLSEYFEEKYALHEYSDKKVQFEIKFLFKFYEDKPDLFLRHFVVGMPDYKPTDQDLDDWSKLDYMFIKHSIGIFGEMDNITEDINVLFNHNYQRVRTFLYMSIFVSIYFIFYALFFYFGLLCFRKRKHHCMTISTIISRFMVIKFGLVMQMSTF